MSAGDSNFVRRILVIDDNPSIHQDFRKILCGEDSADTAAELDQLASILFDKPAASSSPQQPRRLTYQVDCADQGQAGLDKLTAALAQGCPYQVAFVDIRMPPGWDGIETIERLWQADPNLQTVICSAYSDYSWADIRKRLGDSDRLLILRKPFDTAEILQMAAALTEKYRLSQLARMKMEELEKLVDQRTADLKRINEQLEMEVHQRRYAEEQLRHDVLHDRLTGLPNRVLLEDRIAQAIKKRRRQQDYQFAVLFMDIDDFKVVNDSLGHEAGDKLLIEVGRRLTSAVRATDSAARYSEGVTSRLGGDEFVILLDGLSCPEDARLVAQRILNVMSEPFEINGYEVVANLSIGIATSQTEYARAAEILRDADTAVYRAKAKGKRSWAIFDANMHEEARKRLEIEVELRRGVGTSQFRMEYQPILSLRTGRIEGFEALMRWDHPQRGTISPHYFIPLAEATGLIMPLGLGAIQQVCMDVKQWLQMFPDRSDLWVSVNLSGKQLHVADFADQVEKLITDSGVPRSAIRFEITESVLMQQGDAALTTLAKLREKQFLLSMDDFGTGYSSLSRLHELPLACLKVDQSFVQKLDIQSRTYAATVQAIVMLAHNFGFTVVAEGVETHDQIDFLHAVDCDMAQGFLFSPPMTPQQVPALMKQPLPPVGEIADKLRKAG